MEPYRIETTIGADGTLVLTELPFRAGDGVEVIVRPRSEAASANSRYPLRGEPVAYRDPTEPVAESEWGAAR